MYRWVNRYRYCLSYLVLWIGEEFYLTCSGRNLVLLPDKKGRGGTCYLCCYIFAYFDYNSLWFLKNNDKVPILMSLWNNLILKDVGNTMYCNVSMSSYWELQWWVHAVQMSVFFFERVNFVIKWQVYFNFNFWSCPYEAKVLKSLLKKLHSEFYGDLLGTYLGSIGNNMQIPMYYYITAHYKWQVIYIIYSITVGLDKIWFTVYLRAF